MLQPAPAAVVWPACGPARSLAPRAGAKGSARGIAAAIAILSQHAEQPVAVVTATAPVFEHDVMPRVEQAVPSVAATLALGIGLAPQVAAAEKRSQRDHGRAADAKVAGNRLSRPALAMPGRRSANRRRLRLLLSHNRRLTLTRIVTACSPQGRSASVRS